ncbi:caspase family protein [Nostoc sp. NIES-2111]
MANYWAIAIGVNQYHLFQPLRCAQADAEALKDFLIQQAGFLTQQCLLMTDTSAPVEDRPTYPTKDHILLWLEDLAAVCWQPEDHLWFFFSGYGVNHNGRDYLMPVEGDPKFVEETGIEVRSLMQSLQLANLNVLLIFDINRASGSLGETPVGQEIIELAQELQLATILSCQPDQFSQESRELGHGIFTGALLSALRSGYGSDLTQLEQHLSGLTPELSQHYWRPTQNPVAVIPFPEQAILPPVENTTDTEVELSASIPSTIEPSEPEPIIFSEENFAMAFTAPSIGEPPRNTDKLPKFDIWKGYQGVETNGNGKSPILTLDKQPLPSTKTEVTQQPEEESTAGRFIPDAPQPYITRLPANKVEPPLWKQFLLWGGGTMVVVSLISIVLLRNQVKVLKSRQQLAATSDTQIIKTPSTPRPLPKLSPAPLSIPKNQSTAQIAPISESKKRNQAVLDLAKMSLRQTQASDLSLAIATAKKIKLGEPLHEQAQENIKIWSQMILDLAEGRAKQRQYTNAIAAAKLIPKDEILYTKAQKSIEQWRSEAKQFLANQTLIEAAKALIKPGQASTYNRAIEVAKRVPQAQPGFDLAKTSINNWSAKILDLAKNRADQENFDAAIATATLVPEGTAVYEDAQEAIQKWQARKKSQ